MGKSGTVLGLIGLLLGAGGIGLGGLAWLSSTRVEDQLASFSEQTTWYKYNETVFNCIPIYTYLTFSGLMIEFVLGPNESVYFNFVSRAHTEQFAGWSMITVYFKVDGNTRLDPSANVGTYNGDFTVNFMLDLQDVRHDLPPGVHNVTVDIYGTTSANYIWKSSLFVQKFPT